MNTWQLASATYTEFDADGFLGIQIDGFGEANCGLAPFETYHPLGFAARPRDPGEEGGCTVLVFFDGEEGYTVALSDPRAAKSYPVLEKGSSVQYAHRTGSHKSYDLMDGTTGTKTILVEYEGGSHQLTFKGDGSEVVLTTSGSLSATVSGGATVNGAKITAAGDVITATGVSLQNHMTPSPFGPLGPPTPTPGA
jgi:hypothetical protein